MNILKLYANYIYIWWIRFRLIVDSISRIHMFLAVDKKRGVRSSEATN